MAFILGKKLNMTQQWQEETPVPVTVIQAGPAVVTQLRTQAKDGYEAVQIKFGKHRREFPLKSGAPSAGDTITVDAFVEGEKVTITGVSKGKGFQGVVKRHGFSGGPRTHGQKNRLRAPGSIGATAPQRVLLGKKMAGRMGADKITLKNLEVVKIDKDNNLLMVKGAIPGSRGSLVAIISSK